MKRIIAIVLALTFVLALASCGVSPSVKKYKEDVKADEFYEELRKELGLTEDDIFEESLEMVAAGTQKQVSKTKYDGGKTLESKQETKAEQTLKYNEKDDIALLKMTASLDSKSPTGSSSRDEKSEEIYLQSKGDFLAFDNTSKTYTEAEDYEDGVQDEVDSNIGDVIESVFEGVIVLEYLVSDDLSNLTGSLGSIVDVDLEDILDTHFGDDVKVEYYIDKNVYTVVYTEESEDKDDDREKTTESEITVQIIIEDKKLSFVRKEKTVTTYEYKEYTTTDTEEVAFSAEIKFKDVKISTPNEDKYVKLKD